MTSNSVGKTAIELMVVIGVFLGVLLLAKLWEANRPSNSDVANTSLVRAPSSQQGTGIPKIIEVKRSLIP